MLNKIAGPYYPTICLLLFLISYALFFPTTWMITDAHNYSMQAIAFSKGAYTFLQFDFLSSLETSLINAPYSLGNAAYLSLFVLLFGKKYIFIGNVICIVISILSLHRALKNLWLPVQALSIFFLSLPILFFSRSLMSCMPSLMLISLFLSIFTKLDISNKNLIVLGFLTGLSFWFRESNILITGLCSLYLIYKINSRIWPIIFGLCIGLIFRIVSAYIIYENGLFLSASSGFSIESLLAHLPLYLFITVVLVPFSFTSYILFQRTTYKLFAWLSVMFLLFYSAYNYSAVEYSGFLKGSLLTSRFIIPWIPIAVLAFGHVLFEYTFIQKITKYVLIPCSIILVPISQFSFDKMFEPHIKASEKLASKYEEEHLVYDQSGYTNIIRYINPLTGNWKHLADISSLKNDKLRDRYFTTNSKQLYLILSTSSSSQSKTDRANSVKSELKNVNISIHETISIDSNNNLEIYKILPD